MDRNALEVLGRDELLAEARRFGVRRPEVMTRVELVDEVLRLGTPNPVERKKVRGWLGVARDLLASAVEQGLHLPDAAAFIRGDVRYESLHAPQPPVATVTLAEIYGAQGHLERSIGMLDEVLEKEADHAPARKLRDRLEAERERARSSEVPSIPAEPDEDAEAAPPSIDADGTAPTLVPAPREEPEPVTARRGESGLAPEVHAAVLARTTPASAAVYFELPAAAAVEPMVVRVVEVRPQRSGAQRIEHEVSITGGRGTVTIDHLHPGAVLRAAIGRKGSGAFRALAVAAEVTFAPSGVEILWAPRSHVDYREIATRSALKPAPG